jgi:hypothetical protein
LSERWEFAAYSDAASAEVVAGLLRSEDVPVTDEELAFFATARLDSEGSAEK